MIFDVPEQELGLLFGREVSGLSLMMLHDLFVGNGMLTGPVAGHLFGNLALCSHRRWTFEDFRQRLIQQSKRFSRFADDRGFERRIAAGTNFSLPPYQAG